MIQEGAMMMQQQMEGGGDGMHQQAQSDGSDFEEGSAGGRGKRKMGKEVGLKLFVHFCPNEACYNPMNIPIECMVLQERDV